MSKYSKQIKKIIKAEIERQYIAGANIKIIKNGKELYSNQFGLADIENNVEMKEDTIFRMYSMSKPVTAAAAMLLFERGEIDLKDPVSNYLEGFKNQKAYEDNELVDVKKEVTIWDLLNMTSGIVYPGEDLPGVPNDNVFKEAIALEAEGKGLSTVEFCNRLGGCPLAFQPGAAWRYGASIDVLGAVIEVASGKPFGQFLQDELFGPLGMVDTGFYVPEKKWKRFAQNYESNLETGGLRPYTGKNLMILDYKKAPAFESGGAGMVSTIGDYLKFATMLLQDGVYEGKRILGRKTVAYMRTNQLNTQQLAYMDWDSISGYGYGNGMRILMNPAQASTNASVGEFGWDGWTGNYVTIDPVEKMIFLYFIQRIDAGTTLATRKLRAVAFSMADE